MTRHLQAGIAAAFLAAGAAHADGPAPVHLGSSVIMVRYESPEVMGLPRAAVVTMGPFTCPAGHPHEGGECVNLEWWVEHRGEYENADPPSCVAPPCDPTLKGWGTFSGHDGRMAVWHDPTGLTPRSWHVYGEAAGEKGKGVSSHCRLGQSPTCWVPQVTYREPVVGLHDGDPPVYVTRVARLVDGEHDFEERADTAAYAESVLLVKGFWSDHFQVCDGDGVKCLLIPPSAIERVQLVQIVDPPR